MISIHHGQVLSDRVKAATDDGDNKGWEGKAQQSSRCLGEKKITRAFAAKKNVSIGTLPFKGQEEDEKR